MKVLQKIVSWFSAFCIAFSAIFLTIAFLLRYNLQESRIVSYVKNADLTFILKTKDGNSNNLLDDTTKFLKLIGIPESTITEVINSDATKEFVGKYTYKLLHYMIYQEGNIVISKEDIVELTKSNFGVIDTNLRRQGSSFQKKQQDTILGLIDEYSEEIMELFPTANNLLKKINENSLVLYNGITLNRVADFLSVFTSKTFMYSLFGILFLCTFMLFLLHWKSIQGIYYFRISVLLYSFVFIFVEIIMGTLVKDYLMSGWKSANTFLNYLVNVISKSIWVFLLASLFLAIGISLILNKMRVNQSENLSEKTL